jgi:hypothetical protein
MHLASARFRSLNRSLAQNAGRDRRSRHHHESLMTVTGDITGLSNTSCLTSQVEFNFCNLSLSFARH